MKLLPLLDRLAAVPAAPAATPRRAALAHLGRVAAAALPAALAAGPAAAGAKNTSFDVVTQLLLLERLQLDLYTRALAVPGLIPGTQLAGFQRLRTQQGQHVAFLAQAVLNAGAAVPAAPTFDFSGRRNVASNPVLFPGVLNNYDDFLALAQQLEDLGVRLYHTQAFAIVSDAQLAKAALRLHAVEARHSAHVRGLRRDRGVRVKTWPSDDDAAIVRPAAAQALTAAATGGEGNATQFLTSSTPVPFLSFLFLRNTGVRAASLPEAFDEPISAAVAQAAINLFS